MESGKGNAQWTILEYANVLNQVSRKATVFHKITIYFVISHTFISGYIYITLKQKVENIVTVLKCEKKYIYIYIHINQTNKLNYIHMQALCKHTRHKTIVLI